MVKAETRYTARHFRQMVWNGNAFALIIFLYAAFVLNIALMVRLLSARKYGANVDLSLGLGIIFLLLAAACIIYLTFFYEKTLFKRHQRLSPNTVHNCIFNENGFTIDECGDINSSHQEFGYDTCCKAIENGEWFVIYITSTSAHIINKSEITEGTPKELRDLLTDKLGDKFRIKKQI